MPEGPSTATLLTEWRSGNQEAGNQLFAAAYRELRRLAAWQLQMERPGHTLQPTALVNELYVKLFGSEPVAWQNRAHFFAVAARQIRRLLIDYARSHNARKREGGPARLSLTEAGELAAAPPEAHDFIEIDEALTRLQLMDARAASVVELRFFGGLTETESAEALGISVATLKRDWDFARAWLSTQLTG